MKKLTGLLLGLLFAFSSISIVVAQDNMEPALPGPPKVLLVIREFLKPGRAGSIHDKSESAFVQAFTKAKWPTNYIAVDSVSGKPRSLFLVGYPSFDAWEKDNQAMQKNPVLAASMEKAALADGDLLSDSDSTLLTYSEDYSFRAGTVDIATMRYFEISLYHVRPGHHKDWDDLVKLVMTAYEKIPDAHWATFEVAYGLQGGTYAVFSPMKSGADIDKSFAQGKDFLAALGPDGLKKLGDLSAAAIESSQSNLFQFNPRASYPSERFLKADPAFWKQGGSQ